MLRHGPGPFLVNEVVEECQRAVVMKLLEPARKGSHPALFNCCSDR
jgi:hypothetical protein